MKPAERPMSLTMPMPLGRLQRASVLADKMAACAACDEGRQEEGMKRACREREREEREKGK